MNKNPTRKQVLPAVYHGRGKRKEDTTAKRTKGFCLRLSDTELASLRRKAKAAGISVSAFLRDHIGRIHVHNDTNHQARYAVLLSVRKHLLAIGDRYPGFNPLVDVVTIAHLTAIHRDLDQFNSHESAHAHQILPSRNGSQ